MKFLIGVYISCMCTDTVPSSRPRVRVCACWRAMYARIMVCINKKKLLYVYHSGDDGHL